MKCPHCDSDLGDSGSPSKCPFCTGTIGYGDKSGNFWAQFIFFAILSGGLIFWLDFNLTILKKIGWIIGISLAGVLYTRYLLPTKG
jgi:hypothetical protein